MAVNKHLNTDSSAGRRRSRVERSRHLARRPRPIAFEEEDNTMVPFDLPQDSAANKRRGLIALGDVRAREHARREAELRAELIVAKEQRDGVLKSSAQQPRDIARRCAGLS
jgi:hypothetical protein